MQDDENAPETASRSRSAPPRQGRHLYTLRFADEDSQVESEIEFESDDAYNALLIARRVAAQRTAELWRDGRQLCTLRRTCSEVWEILPPNPSATEK